MWRRTVLVLNLLAVINRTSTQHSSNGTEVETPKQCCPCPPVADPAVDLGSAPEAGSEPGVEARAAQGAPAPGDDCPCRPRDADSEGASSLFLPNAVRAAGNAVRPDPAEEVKPLLQPEVDLASSVLETLREATDEDYREALERDAARAASEDTDVNPQEANVVTIIVSPQDIADDPISEASHVQSTRCIDSLLGSPRASFNRSPVHQKGLEEILNLPLPGGLLHRQRDSNLAASNVYKSVVKADKSMNRGLSGLRLRADSGLLNLDPYKISEDINKILSGHKLVSSDISRRKSAQPTKVVTDSMTNMIKNENTDDSEDVSSFETDNMDKQSAVDEDAIDIDQSNLDTDPSPSNVAEATRNEERNLQKEDSFPKLKYPVLAKKSQNLFPLKNLFKLKDVELVPLDLQGHIPKSKVNIPSMKIEPLQTNKASANSLNLKLPKLSDLFKEPSKIITEKGVNKESTDEVIDSGNVEKTANIQTIPRKTIFKTEILDAIPSTSETKPVTLTKDNCISLKPNTNNLSDTETRGDTNSFDSLNTDLDIEQRIESKEEDNLSISDVGIQQGFAPNEIGDSTRDSEVDATKTFVIIDEDQGIDSNEGIIISQEDIDFIDSNAVDLSELNNVEERSNHPLKRLESISKSVVEKLNALELSNHKALDNIKHSVDEIAKSSVSGEERMKNSEKNESSSLSHSVKDEFKEVGTSTEEVTFQDLQNMSDSILSASENQEKAVTTEDVEQEKDDNRDLQSIGSTEEDFESEEMNEDEIDRVLGIDENKRSESKIPNSEAGTNTADINNSIDVKGFVDEKGINLCPSDLVESPSSKTTETKSSDGNENIDNDLATLASEPVVNSILHPNSKSLFEHLGDIESKLRQNIIVQPKPLINTDDLNIFRTPTLSIPDISELHASIPTLDEIRMRVSEILGGLARTAGDEELSSEFDSDDFASNNSPVISTGSSAPNSILPSLKPLEDINLNIIQLKPLPLLPGLHPLKSEFPGLNLNTYKAKLSVPKSLLKPLNLASTLGSDGGLVGATLSVGPEQKVKAGKAKQKTKTNSNYISSARNSPTLADITASIQNNARNLLNLPEAGRGQTLQASNVVQSFAENIKSHTENTMKNIHQTLNPSPVGTFHADLRKNANNLLNSGRSALGSLHTAAPINNAIDSLRAQTENTLKHVHQTLSSPKIADLSSTIHRNAENLLKSPRRPNNKLQSSAALDSLKAQSENTYRNIQQTLNTSPLEDLSKSIHKTAKHILKAAPGINSRNNILRATPQTIPQINGVVDNLRSRTDSTLNNIQQSLNRPALSDINSYIHKSAQQMLKPPELLRNSLQPSIPLDRVVDNLKAHTQSTMRNIQNSLSTPALGDLSAVVPTHGQHLLKSPVAMAGRDAFEQILQASPPMIDLKPHAEKAVKDLQKTIKATLRNSPIKDLQPLTNPNHVLQMISDHHEDVNDKLFAIKTDFADRLESMHNDVMDPERLRSILSPPINRNFELFAIPLPNSRMSSPPSRTQTRPVLKTKQPSIDSQRKESKKSTAPKTYKSGTPKLGEMRSSTGKERGLLKPLKLPTAASAPVPAKIKRPLRPPVPKKPINLKNLLNDIFDPLPPGPEPRKSFESTTTRRPFVPKRKTETKVTFGSTTRRPVLSSVSKRPPFVPKPTTPRPKASNINRFKPKPIVRQPTPWSPARSALKPIRVPDPLTSPSRLAPLAQPKPKLASPVTSNTKIGTLPRLGSLSSRHNSQPLVKPKVSKPKFEISPKANGRSSTPDSKLLSTGTPTTSLLSKLTEALKVQPSKAHLSSPLQRANDNLEMAPAASESIGSVVAIENPMKENVAYKCKMTCVKLD